MAAFTRSLSHGLNCSINAGSREVSKESYPSFFFQRESVDDEISTCRYDVAAKSLFGALN